MKEGGILQVQPLAIRRHDLTVAGCTQEFSSTTRSQHPEDERIAGSKFDTREAEPTRPMSKQLSPDELGASTRDHKRKVSAEIKKPSDQSYGLLQIAIQATVLVSRQKPAARVTSNKQASGPVQTCVRNELLQLHRAKSCSFWLTIAENKELDDFALRTCC